jgi:predicted nucleotidyltransferase
MKINDELKQSVEKATKVLKAAGAREVYLFGSAATGNMREGSDIDIAVSGLPPETFFQVMAKVADILGHSVDLIDLDEANPFTRYLKEEGELQRVG